jgi:hypothetical protein
MMDIDCPYVEVASPRNWALVADSFARSTPLHFHQFWKQTPEDNFRSGEVRTGWSADGVWVYAVLEDEDINNEEETANAFFFLKGDVFEIFVRPENQDAYFEFHVGPANQQLQMRIPSAAAFANQKDGESDGWKISEPLMSSWVQVDEENKRWKVLVFLPFARIVEGEETLQDWRISFSRYDYTRGNKRPILSSTSQHSILGFHRQHEWAKLRFVSPKQPLGQ